MARPKMRYAHQGGMNPPVIVIHGNALDDIPQSYVRYLERCFMEAFKLQGTPLRIQFRTTHNPYARGPEIFTFENPFPHLDFVAYCHCGSAPKNP
jgi:hypothetical protein